ncbi:MAG: hypothetical protein ACK52I_08345 [Pseudomonadota bacterium]|jgi:hypothetical protein
MPMVITSFLIEPMQNHYRSEQEGRDIYDDVVCIRKIIAGSKDEIFRIATEEDKREWPKEYAAFLERGDLAVSGTPLTEWPAASASFAREMAFFNVKTVEQLAGLADGAALQMGMGIQDKAVAARAWLKAANSNEAQISKVAAENEKLGSALDEALKQIEIMKAQMAELQEIAEEKTAPQLPLKAGK